MNLKSLIHQNNNNNNHKNIDNFNQNSNKIHNYNKKNNIQGENANYIISKKPSRFIQTQSKLNNLDKSDNYNVNIINDEDEADDDDDELNRFYSEINKNNREKTLVKSYSYRYQIVHPNRIESENSLNSYNTKKSFLQIKLKDLIDFSKEKVLVDNLYAQFYADSNLVNLVYVSPMDKVPANTILLDNKFIDLLKNRSVSGGSSSALNLSSVNTTFSSSLDANKLLNEFYLNAAMRRNSSYHDYQLTGQLLNSEICLIMLVIFLWLLSIFVCFRRYSLVLCYHKNDVPFYNANLINVGIHKVSVVKSVSSCATVKALGNYPSCNNNKTSCSIFNSMADNDIVLGSEFSGNACNTPDRITRHLTPSLNNRLVDNSSLNSFNHPLTIRNKYSLISSEFDNKQNRLDSQFRHSSIMSNELNSVSSRSINNKIKMSLTGPLRNHNSSLVMNSTTYNKNNRRNITNESFQDYRLNYDKTGLLNRCKKNSNLFNRLNNNSRPSTLVTLPSSDANSESIEKADIVENFDPPKKERNSLNTKRGFIRNKHFNLMSLDEGALNTYREEHKINQTKQLQKKNQNLTIPQNNMSVPKKLTERAVNNSPQLATSHNASNTTIDERGIQMSTPRIQKLHPHANFISLRSGGSDSVYNNSWIKHGRSYDIDNSDNSNSNDIFSSCSLQQSQTLLQPPQTSISSFHNRSSSPINGSSNLNNLAFPKRAINPISSLRRHMFVNSRRNAQTTIDYNTNFEDSLNKELSNENFVTLETNNETMIEPLAKGVNTDLTPTPPKQPIETNLSDKDPNLLNPSWIPLVVRNTLLEMHEEAALNRIGKKSNGKYKIRSTNHLLHSPHKNHNKNTNTSSKTITKRKKKPLSLQNSKEKEEFISTSSKVINDLSNTSSSSNFFEELRAKIFQKSSSPHSQPSPLSKQEKSNEADCLQNLNTNQPDKAVIIDSTATVDLNSNLVSNIENSNLIPNGKQNSPSKPV